MSTRGWENVKSSDLQRGRRSKALRVSGHPDAITGQSGKRSKYHAKPTTVDGIRFASQKEARRYVELKALEKAGKITDLTLQPKYELCATNRDQPHRLPIAIGAYMGDFRYRTVPWDYEASETVIEDVKGFKTPLYRWKKKHVEAQYGITIHEV